MNISMRVQTFVLSAALLMPGASLMAQGTLERIAARGEFRIGYDPDARPLSFVQDGEPAGYSVDICRRIAVGVREHLRLPDMKVTYVEINLDNRFDAVVNGDIDIECASTTMTLGRQERVDFTLMTFVTGGTVLSMAKNRVATMEDLAGKRVAVIRNTTSEAALEAHLKEKLIDARVIKVADSGEGLSRLQRGDVDAYASDQVVLIGDAMKALDADPKLSFSFADELFSYEPYALTVRRNDAEFRLVANRVIAQLFRSGQFAQLYQDWIGSVGLKPSPMLVAMYQVQALSE
ncbi:MAG TPA: amino acid ABC transporter substrate-binding protein [Vicinamibacterales bacterium]|nr:amino acid ABC transporter substrate-binding protein [Vicinamibacterales bacterium]